MDKPAIRTRAKGHGPIDEATSFMVVSGLFVWLSRRVPGTAAAFLALPDEIDVTPLFEQLPGWRWVLPRVEPDRHLTFRDRDVPTEIHRYGMEQPTAQGVVIPFNQLDVVLVPGVGFDRTGARVGRGAGYYDRLLAEVRADTESIGVTTVARVYESVPTEAHDMRVGWLATEAGVRECSPNSGFDPL